MSSALMARFDREELYERVWTVPIRVLAKRYRVSDVALAKIVQKTLYPSPGARLPGQSGVFG